METPFGPFDTLDEIKQANASSGQHFFAPEADEFFDTRYETGVLFGRYFITSDAFDQHSERRYTVREVDDNGKLAGDLEEGSLHEFQRFATLDEAVAAIHQATGRTLVDAPTPEPRR